MTGRAGRARATAALLAQLGLAACGGGGASTPAPATSLTSEQVAVIEGVGRDATQVALGAARPSLGTPAMGRCR